MQLNKKLIFIAGSPRCGSSSLFTYLNAHPAIHGSEIKELSFFIDKGYFPNEYHQNKFPNIHTCSLADYYNLFNDGGSYQICLDGTVNYMYQKKFTDNLPKFTPVPLLLFVLRKPSDRIYSIFQYARGNRAIIRKKLTFSDFISLVKANEPELCRHGLINNCIEKSKYIFYLKKIENLIGRDNMLVFTYEELVETPSEIVGKVFEKLNIKDNYYDKYVFNSFNESYTVKYPIIRKIYDKIPLSAKFKYGHDQSGLKKYLKKIYLKFNAREKTSKSDDDLKMLRKLDEIFLNSNMELASAYSLNISNW